MPWFSTRKPADDAESSLIDADDVPGVGDLPSSQNLGTATDQPDSGPDVDRLTADRAALIDLVIYAFDRARSPGVHERLTEGLAAVGVEVVRPDGLPYDPSSHEVGGVENTEDPALVDTIAETEMVGFTDSGTVLREPVVVVYRQG